MKKLFFWLIIFFATPEADAQVGITAAHHIAKAEDWFPGQSFSGNSLGVDYWFRLKKRRIEFLPELSFAAYNGKDAFANDVDWRASAFHFNVNFYLFDFDSDCNCPTFSKTGGHFQRGFFLQISPGVIYMNNSKTSADNVKNSDKIVAPGGGIGAGYDIGLSNFITLTPLVKFIHYQNVEWQDFDGNPASDDFSTSNINQLYGGLRVGIRWNGKKY
jgi:hypothetical protein